MTELKNLIDDDKQKPERRIPALAVSRGVGIGRIVFLHGQKRQFFRIDLPDGQIDDELDRFRSAVNECRDQLKKLAAPKQHKEPNQPVSSIFGVHLLIIEESSLVGKIETAIRDRKVNAEWALKIVSDQYLERQGAVADLHFREKYLDIEDVSERILTSLLGSPSSTQREYYGAIVAARELRPSAILELIKTKPAAIITERGGWTSHTSILAREFNVPMASGLKNLDKVLKHGDRVIVDGIGGEVIVDPRTETVEHFALVKDVFIDPDEFTFDETTPATTADGTEITIRANVDVPEAYQLASHFGADGIGLFRSESLITRPGTIPSEDEQVAAYHQIAEAAGDSGVNIRTFDIGVDQLGQGMYSTERNPALGLRAIRLFLSEPDEFKTQIRAILRSSHNQKINILLPMVSGVGDVIRCREIIDDVRKDLSKSGTAMGDPQIGAMIEVPSAVFMAEEIGAKVDFFCLGTNDLVQYLLAIDRDNDSVSEWYQTLHPAVLRAITDIIFAGKNNGIPVVVCGEMAGSAFYVPVLIGLGLVEFSMNVNSIQEIRRLIAGIKLTDAVELVNQVKLCETTADTESVLRSYYLEHWKDLFPIGLLGPEPQ